MDDIKKDIREINEKLDRLARHIDFVESTYTIIKRPMAYVCSKLPGGSPQLPELKDKE